MVSKNSVMRWWTNNFLGEDPRGKSPSLFHIYNYKNQKWELFCFL